MTRQRRRRQSRWARDNHSFAASQLLSGLLVVAVFATITGCGSSDFEFAPVSGTVTLDGNPVAGVGVTFQPQAAGAGVDAGPGSYGVTDDQGKYALKVTGQETAGAVVGKHRVTFALSAPERAADDDTAAPPPKQILPPKVLNSELQFDVPAGGTDKADFPLTSN